MNGEYDLPSIVKYPHEIVTLKKKLVDCKIDRLLEREKKNL